MAWHVCLIDEDANPEEEKWLSTFCGQMIGCGAYGNSITVFLRPKPWNSPRLSCKVVPAWPLTGIVWFSTFLKWNGRTDHFGASR